MKYLLGMLKKQNGDLLGSPMVKLDSNAGSVGSIPAWGTKIPHALCPKTKT